MVGKEAAGREEEAEREEAVGTEEAAVGKEAMREQVSPDAHDVGRRACLGGHLPIQAEPAVGAHAQVAVHGVGGGRGGRRAH